MTMLGYPTLGDIVVANPAAARVLETLGLDYCCHGDHTLDEACAAAGLDVEQVAEQIADLRQGGDASWAELELPELAKHIEGSHHAYLHAELPLLDALAAKVAGVHGERHPELREVARLVSEIRTELDPHLMKEERILFPAIEAMFAGQTEFPFGTVANPIRMMEIEHDQCGELLDQLRATSKDYAVPDDGCASYRSLYERLEALEYDLHIHIHKENHVLFPQAIAYANA